MTDGRGSRLVLWSLAGIQLVLRNLTGAPDGAGADDAYELGCHPLFSTNPFES